MEFVLLICLLITAAVVAWALAAYKTGLRKLASLVFVIVALFFVWNTSGLYDVAAGVVFVAASALLSLSAPRASRPSYLDSRDQEHRGA